MTIYVSPHADLQSQTVGADSRVWQFVVILSGARIGTGCNIGSRCFIENDVIVGGGVMVNNRTSLCGGLRLAEDIVVGPNVIFTNDSFPRSNQYLPAFAVTTVGAGASFGWPGDHPATHNDRPRRNGGRRCGGENIDTRQLGDRRQPRAPLPLSRRQG